MIRKRPSINEGKVMVSFEIPGTIWVERINLVGDFNNWDHKSLPFRYNREENWQVEVELEAGREYRFRYLFDDDQWRDDWHADKYIMDPHGKYHSSIVIAKVPPETRCVQSWCEKPVTSDATLQPSLQHSMLHPSSA